MNQAGGVRAGRAAAGLVLDRSTGELRGDGNEAVHLTEKECRLLGMLMTHSGHVLSHRLLMQRGWDTHYTDDLNVLYVHIHRLRGKLRKLGGARIQTVRGVGYRLRPS